jgi:hypothetical protein
MSELYDRIVSQRGRLENIIAKIPGFKGYHEKEARRQADRMLRDYLSGELGQRVDRLVRLENRILNNIGMAPLTATRDAKTVMQHYADRVKTAAPRYDGMWATMKIGPEELDKIYSFDEAQVQYLDKFDDALEALEAAIGAPDTLDAAIEGLHAVATEAHDAFDLRDEVLTNLSKTV